MNVSSYAIYASKVYCTHLCPFSKRNARGGRIPANGYISIFQVYNYSCGQNIALQNLSQKMACLAKRRKFSSFWPSPLPSTEYAARINVYLESAGYARAEPAILQPASTSGEDLRARAPAVRANSCGATIELRFPMWDDKLGQVRLWHWSWKTRLSWTAPWF